MVLVALARRHQESSVNCGTNRTRRGGQNTILAIRMRRRERNQEKIIDNRPLTLLDDRSNILGVRGRQQQGRFDFRYGPGALSMNKETTKTILLDTGKRFFLEKG